MDRLRLLTWHVHGGYLESLAWIGHTIYLPVRDDPRDGYGGRPAGKHLPDAFVEVPADQVRDLDLDAVLFQSPRHYLEDQQWLLSDAQRRLPQVYLEHDPPRGHPTDTRHIVDDPNVTLVHCTYFNDLMWDSGRTPTRVVEHGVRVSDDVSYSGELERGIVVVNDLATRGRRLGRDVFEEARERVPLDLVGLNSRELGGLGPIDHDDLAAFTARYRFFFNPIRYTSLGLSMIEAMMIGLPVVALATTEQPTVLRDGETGFIATDRQRLIEVMRTLLEEPELAREVGAAGREVALERFGIERFAGDWDRVLREAIARGPAGSDRVVPEPLPGPGAAAHLQGVLP